MFLILCTQHCYLVPKHFHLPQMETPCPSSVSPLSPLACSVSVDGPCKWIHVKLGAVTQQHHGEEIRAVACPRSFPFRGRIIPHTVGTPAFLRPHGGGVQLVSLTRGQTAFREAVRPEGPQGREGVCSFASGRHPAPQELAVPSSWTLPSLSLPQAAGGSQWESRV